MKNSTPNVDLSKQDEIKAATGGATTRCICKEDQVKDGDTCIFCGKQAKHVVYFGKAY